MARRSILISVSLFILFGETAQSQDQSKRLVLDPIRAVAGESRAAKSNANRVWFKSVNAVRITPPLRYPIRVDLDSESTVQIVIPPATPPGRYEFEITGPAPDGSDSIAILQVTVEPVVVSAANGTSRVPVILLNGWQTFCSDTSSSLVASKIYFGQLATLLQSDGAPVLFFNNCSYGTITIEELGQQLGAFITSLHYTNGTPVTQIDLIGHSMGGLIARAYLSGKSTDIGVFTPPADHRIHKLVTIATPHFGSFEAIDFGVQSPEMVPGSQFLWDLATWNQGQDDLRGVDALAIVGNAGNYYSQAGFDDGVVSLTSGSLTFAEPDQRTRIVPYCHTTPSLFLSCPMNAQGIAQIADASHLTAQIVRSFLSDTDAWQSLGTTPSQNIYLKIDGGIHLALKGSNDVYYSNISNVDVDNGLSQLYEGPDSSTASIYFREKLSAGQHTFTIDHLGGQIESGTGTVPAGGAKALLFKFGPLISWVESTSSTGLPGLTVAAESMITIGGIRLASSAQTRVLANGTALWVAQVSDQQITAYLPSSYSGLVKLKVVNGNGQHTVNIMTAPAIVPPAISLSKAQMQFAFTQGGILPQPQTFTVSNAGSGSLSWSLTSSSQWISVSPAAGTTPATVTVSVNATSLAPGLYGGTITVSAPGATNSHQIVSIALTVTALPTISLSKMQYQFSYAAGGVVQSPQTLAITNAGGDTLSWSIASSAAWLTASPTTGIAPATVTITVNPASQILGSYNGNLTITATGATNSPQVILVSLIVSPAPSSVSLSKTQCQFAYLAGDVPPTSQSVMVSNAGGGTLSWTAASSAQWLTVSPTSGTAPNLFTVSVDPSSLNPGPYNATVTVEAIGATTSSQVLSVRLTVTQGYSTFFPQVAVGGSDAIGGIYTTIFTLINTGGDQLSGDLILTSNDGTPLTAKLSSDQTSTTASSFPVSLGPGQTMFISAVAAAANDTKLYTGWGRVVSSGGTLSGVATFQLSVKSALRTTAGVLSASSVSQATVPVDDDVAVGRFTGYAVANVGSSSIVLSVNETSSDGKDMTALTDISLAPGQQKSAFFFQDPKAQQKFRGTAVVAGKQGARFAIVALVDNQNLMTSIPAISAKDAISPTIFGHLAIGGGYSTMFTLLNTGSDALTGQLTLTGQDGTPLRANMSDGLTSTTDSNFLVTIQPAGVKFVAVSSTNETDTTKAGWGNLISTSGVPGGVATFQMAATDGTLQTIAGVLSSPTVAVATIPVDDDFSANRLTGYGIANLGSSAITIKAREVSADATVTTALADIVLAPGEQKATFFYQDPKAQQKFRGSAVLIGQNGASFAVVAIVENQNLLTSIPVIAGKAPNIQ